MLLVCPLTVTETQDQPKKKEKVAAPLADVPSNAAANFHGQARNQSFALGLSASTYRPNINLFVLLTQYGTLCQARISCLESYYRRGKTPRVYELATWQQCSGFFLLPVRMITLCETSGKELHYSRSVGQRVAFVVLLGTKFWASNSTESGVIRLRSVSAWRVLLYVEQEGNFLL